MQIVFTTHLDLTVLINDKVPLSLITVRIIMKLSLQLNNVSMRVDSSNIHMQLYL